MFPLDRLYESGNISAGSDVFSGYALRDGSIGIYENFPYDFRNGTEIAGKKWTITDMELPFCRLRANIYTNSEATDATALITSGTDSNAIMSHFEEMAIWVRFYVVYRYNSDIANRVPTCCSKKSTCKQFDSTSIIISSKRCHHIRQTNILSTNSTDN